ncbi:MAG: L-threonylcarbamoyladenylate synthase [Bacteroidota bacterium]
MTQIGHNLNIASQLLVNGGLVAIPTETVYGLAANALNEKALLSIFETKQRPSFDPLIMHLSDITEVEKYAHWNDARLKKLAEIFWPGPLTILLPKKELVPDIVCSGLPQVALRVPNHPLTLQLLKQLPFPLAAPSANPFGYISPTSAQHVKQQLGNMIPYILDGGECTVGLESTIVGVEDNELVVYRLGGLTLELIESHIGKLTIRLNQSGNPLAPGQLKSHYAPRKPLFIGSLKDNTKKFQNQKIGIIGFGDMKGFDNKILMFNLSEKADLKEAALNLFKHLRLADESEADVILTDFLPAQGLGLAINDRLQRAAVK